jgi:hypothetical protein
LNLLSIKVLFWIYVGTILSFTAIYFFLSRTFPAHGLTSKTDVVISVLDSGYFSIVAITSLGYGDIAPLGFSRLIAAAEVLIGLIVMGLIIAKLAVEAVYIVRIIFRKVGGVWFGAIKFPNNDRLYSITQIDLSNDGLSLKYSGQDYTPDAVPAQQFESHLIELKWPKLKFLYKSEDVEEGADSQEDPSKKKYFHKGVTSITFDDNDPDKFTANIYDYKAHEETTIVGTRVTDKNTLRRLEDDTTKVQAVQELIEKLGVSETTESS